MSSLSDLICSIFVVITLPTIAFSANRYFGSKTPYELPPTDWNAVAREAKLPSTCQLIHLRFVARHGTRTMDEEKVADVTAAIAQIAKAVNNSKQGKKKKSSLSDLQLQRILAWKNQLPTAKELLERGKAEHRRLANDYYNLLKTSPVLSKATSFRFESSNVQRARDSADAFKGELAKLYGRVDDQAVKVNETLLYYHKQCPKYQTRVSKNKTCEAEAQRAKLTKDGKSLIKDINEKKLRLDDDSSEESSEGGKVGLNWDQVFAMYEMMGFEMAALNTSVLLPLFDEDALSYLEYADDLEQYWMKSYSNDPITRDMSCFLLGDIFSSAKQAYDQNSQGKYVESGFGFSHLETLLPVYGALGLFHDPERSYVAQASHSFYEKRKYDTSEMGKMASNFAFLFYNCPNTAEPRDKLVVMMVNGRPQALPRACPNELLCPMKTIQEAYPLVTGYPEVCAFQEVCSLNNSTKTKSAVPSRNYPNGRKYF